MDLVLFKFPEELGIPTLLFPLWHVPPHHPRSRTHCCCCPYSPRNGGPPQLPLPHSSWAPPPHPVP